jgi:hypothetical protein
MSQGASGGAGQGAGNNRFVKFTRPAAQRIAAAVRKVEGGNRDQPPFGFEHPQGIGGAKVFRVCTYTGSWSKGSAKTVTFKYATGTPNTVSATNLFFPITSTATSSTDCAIAKDGTAWFLIDVPLFTSTAVFVGSTSSGIAVQSTATGIAVQSTATSAYVTDISLSASLNTSNCTISIGKTLTTASSIFITGTATSVFVAGTATTVFVSTTYTATFVTFGR